MPPTVTIGMPTYNRADRFLRSALEHALAQTWQELEIIVSDNCSDDNTREIVNSYSDPRLRYVRQERNIGANANFNYCLNHARGDYFLLYHDDDVIDPDMVSVCMEATGGRSDYGLIRTGTRLIDGDGAVIREIPNRAAGLDYAGFFREWMKDNVTSYVCSTLFNTRLLTEIGGFESKHGLYQDLIAIAKILGCSERCDVREVKASFRRHEGNFGNAADLRAWCEDGMQLAEVIAAQAPDKGEDLYMPSMRYLCQIIYGYARRFLPSRVERVKAYKMIDREFDHCYPYKEYIFYRTVTRRYRNARSTLRNELKRPG
jgi:glycosyltransferase involved in cell wall biosynthesis